MPDFIIALSLWLPNISDINIMDYRIWSVLQERVYQQPVRDVDVLTKRLIDRMIVKQPADGH